MSLNRVENSAVRIYFRSNLGVTEAAQYYQLH